MKRALKLLPVLLFTSMEGVSAPLIDARVAAVLGKGLSPSLTMPTDVAAGRDGALYLLDGLNSRVVVFSPKGEFISSFGIDCIDAVGIGVDTKGRVMVTDTGRGEIRIMTPRGKLLKRFGLKVTGKDRADPTDVLASPLNDYIYITDNDGHRVIVLDRDGKVQFTFGSFGENLGQFRYPATLSIDRLRHIYVVDTLNSRVQVFNPYGRNPTQIGKFGVAPGRLYRPKGVAVDPAGRVFVSDSYLGVVQVFNEAGVFLGILGEKGRPIKFETPTNIVFTEDGRLLVVETKPGRVKVIKILKRPGEK